MNSIILIAVFVAVVAVSMSEGANIRGQRPHLRYPTEVKMQQQDRYENHLRMQQQNRYKNQLRMQQQDRYGNQPPMQQQDRYGNHLRMQQQDRYGNQPQMQQQNRYKNQPPMQQQDRYGNHLRMQQQDHYGRMQQADRYGNHPQMQQQDRYGNQLRMQQDINTEYDYYDTTITIEILVSSCTELKIEQPDVQTGFHDLLIREERKSVFCNFEEICGDNGGWTRVAHLNMTEADENCPENLRLSTIGGVRMCGRGNNLCESETLDTLDVSYTKVCGRVTGFQKGSPDSFDVASSQKGNIDRAYVDGVSITKGSPREHVWTYVASITENSRRCPCDTDSTSNSQPPNFVGDDYYCESATVSGFNPGTTYTNDLQWDGKQCGSSQETCCNAVRDMPWFEKVLEESSKDELELRVCADQSVGDEDIRLNFYEIYVK